MMSSATTTATGPTAVTSSPSPILSDRLTCRVFTKSEEPQLLEGVMQLRKLVFIDEQVWPEWVANDESDDAVLHVAAVQDTGRVVGAARLLPVLERDGSRMAKVERMLVAGELQRSGVGALVMRALLDEARRRGFSGAVLDSIHYACGFYEKLGFRTEGEKFMKGIYPHYFMRLTF